MNLTLVLILVGLGIGTMVGGLVGSLTTAKASPLAPRGVPLYRQDAPELWKVIEEAVKKIRTAGKAPGILVGEADGQRCLDLGFLFVAVGSDIGLLVRGADSLAAKFKSASA